MRAAPVLVALALAGACRDAQLENLEALRDEVCACKTVRCVDEAMKRVPPPDGESSHRHKKVARRMMECVAERYQAPSPTAPSPTSPPSPTTQAEGE